ncbi:hypothetical protein H9X85_11205 [Anaerotignum lactatifermentans]|uniref:Uncharacterized protein n=1 Tax=Anaerotignum lactatifermentans TaxID=160404 RepID=A0ABS2GC02_9FIRM|nr:hypothetical protein [Anaerotignum lactatifermentans]MBM6830148.1 hypothetical protein [Anaerotignum lactatifermentans]MBM6878707.1 hypothetical protein [Anaerotignum lactatifermentans]MBM6951761.1 hypothetical protein [Anaerotignum lactatifermentans]
MKLTLEELIEDVKNELLCYEDAEETAQRWEEEFRAWAEEQQGKNKDLSVEGDRVMFRIKDEEEVFEIADSYMDALEEGSVKKYWEKF